MSDEETTAERYQRELNERVEVVSRAVHLAQYSGGPFEEAYAAIAEIIVGASNMYVALRIIEDLMEVNPDAS